MFEKIFLLFVFTFLLKNGFAMSSNRVGTNIMPILNRSRLYPGKSSYLDGHCAYFRQDFSRFLKEDGKFHMTVMRPEILNMLFSGELTPDEEPIIKFGTIKLPLKLNITRDGAGFTIIGPHFSLMVETAGFLNYSLQGYHILDEAMMSVAMREKVHFAVGDIFPALRVAEICDNELSIEMFGIDPTALGLPPLGEFTKTHGTFEMDHVLQHIKWKGMDPFRMASAFEAVTWYLLLAGGFLVALVLSLEQWKHFGLSLEFVIYYSVFGCPELDFLSRIPFPVTIWLTAVWLLQQYYGGDMLSALMEPPQLEVVDSLIELAKADKTVMVMSTELWARRNDKAVLEDYFKGYGDIRFSLMAQSQVIDYIKDFQEESKMVAFLDYLIKTKDKYKVVCLMPRPLGEFIKNKLANKKFQPFIHLSEEGGDIQPLFYISIFFASQEKRDAINYVILHLNEAGVYQRWLKWATFGRRDSELPPPLAEYEAVGLTTFQWPFFFCFCLLFVSTFVFLFENGVALVRDIINYLKNKRTKVTPNRVVAQPNQSTIIINHED